MAELALRKGIGLRKRSVALMAALALAALATTALVSYVRGLENRAYQGAQTVEVLTAKADIPANTPIEVALQNGLIERTLLPRKALAVGAITSLADVQGKVASVALVKGEQLVAARFVAPEDTGTILPIPAGHQAMTLSVSVPHGVGGFIVPGNHVSLIGRFDLPAKKFATAGISDPKEARFLLQDIEVLAVNQDVAARQAPATEEEANAAKQQGNELLLTLAVTPKDAERVAYAAFGGDTLWITLLPKGQGPTKTTGRNPLNIVSR